VGSLALGRWGAGRRKSGLGSRPAAVAQALGLCKKLQLAATVQPSTSMAWSKFWRFERRPAEVRRASGPSCAAHQVIAGGGVRRSKKVGSRWLGMQKPPRGPSPVGGKLVLAKGPGGGDRLVHSQFGRPRSAVVVTLCTSDCAPLGMLNGPSDLGVERRPAVGANGRAPQDPLEIQLAVSRSGAVAVAASSPSRSQSS